MEAFVLFFAFFLTVVIIAGSYLLYADIRHSQYAKSARLEAELKDRAMRRTREFNTLKYDERGNPEVVYRRATGEYFVPPLGNSNLPVQMYIQPGQAGSAPRVTELRPPSKSDIVIRAWNAQQVRGEVEAPEELPAGPEFPELSEPDKNRKFEPEFSSELNSEFGIQEKMAQAKARGEAKNATITALTGATPGGSRAWKEASALWDNL